PDSPRRFAGLAPAITTKNQRPEHSCHSRRGQDPISMPKIKDRQGGATSGKGCACFLEQNCSRAEKTDSVESQEAGVVRWCVVHGRSLPAPPLGLGSLQFHAGQAWVLEKPRRGSALFSLPAGNFPPNTWGNHMLRPECVHRNQPSAKSLR
ncbi:hypothetical protein EI555_002667, partial [Monodon monoceros]